MTGRPRNKVPERGKERERGRKEYLDDKMKEDAVGEGDKRAVECFFTSSTKGERKKEREEKRRRIENDTKRKAVALGKRNAHR